MDELAILKMIQKLEMAAERTSGEMRAIWLSHAEKLNQILKTEAIR